MFIIDDLLLWLPAKGLTGVFKKVHELAEDEQDSENQLKRDLLKLQMKYDLGLISKKDFIKEESAIMRRVNQFYHAKRQRIIK